MGTRALVLAALVLAGAASRADADCARAVAPEGEPALVRSLVDRLAASGIATHAGAGCPVVSVRIEHRGSQVHLTLADAFQRTSERDVQDVATAAAIVESWTYQEVEARALPPEPVTAVAAPSAPTRDRIARSGLTATAISALATNGTTWLGGALSGCARIGPSCAGAAARIERDLRATGDTSVSQDLTVASATATLDLPLALAGLVVSPGLGAGYGWLHVTTHHHDPAGHPLDMPTTDHQLCAEAHVAVLWRWSDRLAGVAELSGDAAAWRSNPQFGPGAALRLGLGVRIEVP